MAKVIAFTIKVNGVDVTIKNQKELNKQIVLTNNALKGADFGTQEYRRLQGELAKLKNVQKGVADETRRTGQQLVVSADKGAGSYRALHTRLTLLKNEFKELSAASRKGIDGQKLQREIAGISGELKKIDKGLGDNFRNVGNYQSAFQGLIGTLKGAGIIGGVAAGIRAVTGAISDGVRVFIDFRDAVQILGGISGATAEELKALEDDAKRLGETTQFTARQVVDLQTNFAKVGFSTPEILSATEATINLAIATGEDLARSSETVAATLGGYQLSAQETTRVTDVMAASFNSTALSLDNFGDATKFVAPIATVAGVAIEQSTAAIGALADAGLRGTNAGTSLRRVFSELNNENSKLSKRLGVTVTDAESFNEAMRRLGEQNLTTADAIDLVGRNASSGFLILASNTDKVLGLSAAYANVAGTLGEVGLQLEDVPEKFRRLNTAAEVAKRVQDSIAGDVRTLSSAVEGFKIKTVQNFEGVLRFIVQFATKLVRSIGDATQFIIDAFRPVIDAVRSFVTEIASGTQAGDTFRAIVRAIGGVIVYVTNIISSAINSLTAFVKSVKNAASGVGILNTAFNAIRTVVSTVIDSIAAIPAVLNGVFEASRQLGENLKSGKLLGGLEDAFNRGFEQASNFTKRLKEEAEKQDTLFTKQAGNIRRIFREIRKDSKGTEEVAARLKILAETTGVSYEKLSTEFSRFMSSFSDDVESSGAKAESAIDRLQRKQRDLKDQIEEAALAGEDYTDLLDEYKRVSEQLEKANAATADAIRKTPNLVEGSIAFIEKQLSELRAKLENQVETNEIRDTLQQIANKEKELERVKTQIDLIRDTINQVDGAAVNSLIDFSAPDVAAEQAAALEALYAKRSEGVEREIDRIEKERFKKIEADRAKIDSEEELAKRRQLINLEADRAILEQRLALEEIGTLQYLKTQQELADKTVEINRLKNETVVSEEQEARRRIAESAFSNLQKIADFTFQLARETAKQETEEQLTRLEEQYARRIELVEGNEEEQARLRKELEAKSAVIEKEAAEKDRQRAIRQAFINMALAIGNALATTQPFFPAGLIAAAQAGAAGLAQIALIRKQKFAKGGYVGNAPPGVRADETGRRPAGVVHEGEYVTPADVVASAEGARLVSELESIRIRRPRRATPGRYAEGGLVAARSNAAVPQVSVSGQAATLELSEDDVEFLADTIGNRVERATERGSARGTAAGMDRQDRIKERQARQEINRTV